MKARRKSEQKSIGERKLVRPEEVGDEGFQKARLLECERDLIRVASTRVDYNRFAETV